MMETGLYFEISVVTLSFVDRNNNDLFSQFRYKGDTQQLIVQ